MPAALFLLPELDPSKLVYKLRYTDFTILPDDSFVRPIKTMGYLCKNSPDLSKLLRLADEQFQLLAEICGAVVVPHTWGIVRADPERTSGLERAARLGGFTYCPDSIVKPEYILAAEVEAISPKETPCISSEFGKNMINLLCYRYEEENRQKKVASDMNHSQFTTGTTKTISTLSLILHDIDPIIGYSQY